jgi:hypothetical protein
MKGGLMAMVEKPARRPFAASSTSSASALDEE